MKHNTQKIILIITAGFSFISSIATLLASPFIHFMIVGLLDDWFLELGPTLTPLGLATTTFLAIVAGMQLMITWNYMNGHPNHYYKRAYLICTTAALSLGVLLFLPLGFVDKISSFFALGCVATLIFHIVYWPRWVR